MKTLSSAAFSLLLILTISSCALAGDLEKKLTRTTTETEATPRTCSTPATQFQANIFQNAAGRVSVILLKTDHEPVTLDIHDNENRLLFSEKIKEDSIRQNFRMTELDPGNYRFSLSKNGECFTKTVTVK